MTEAQRQRCKRIIHSWSAAAGAGNLSPIPGTGLAADVTALAMMARELAGVFGEDKPAAAAHGQRLRPEVYGRIKPFATETEAWLIIATLPNKLNNTQKKE